LTGMSSARSAASRKDEARATWQRGKTGSGPWRQLDVDRLAGSVGRLASPCRRTKVRFCGPTREPAAGSQQFQLPCPRDTFGGPLPQYMPTLTPTSRRSAEVDCCASGATIANAGAA
jgi:hypothetical protein